MKRVGISILSRVSSMYKNLEVGRSVDNWRMGRVEGSGRVECGMTPGVPGETDQAEPYRLVYVTDLGFNME